MPRRATITVLVALTVWTIALAQAAQAGGGGGCTRLSRGTGSTVELVEFCFTPNILFVDPDTEVTFVNRDLALHNVVGVGMYEELKDGRGFTATFQDEGVYPFACTYHPGMVGAVVVGDGVGLGNAPVAVRELVAPSPEVIVVTPEPQIRTVERTVERTSPAGWLVGGLVGLLGGGTLGAMVARRRRAPEPEQAVRIPDRVG